MSLKVREGGAWIKVSDGANGANGLDGVDAKVLQEQYSEMSNRVDIAQSNIIPIAGLSVNIIPLKTNTKLLLEANIMTNAYYVSSFGFSLLQGSDIIPLGGNPNTNSNNAISTLYSYGDAVATQGNLSIHSVNMYSVTYRYLYTQSVLTPVGGLTFAPTACSSDFATRFLFQPTLTINNRPNNDMLSTSSITVKEIEV